MRFRSLRVSAGMTTDDFNKVDLRAGIIVDVKENKKVQNQAYVLALDFGDEAGIKKSFVQITKLYTSKA